MLVKQISRKYPACAPEKNVQPQYFGLDNFINRTYAVSTQEARLIIFALLILSLNYVQKLGLCISPDLI